MIISPPGGLSARSCRSWAEPVSTPAKSSKRTCAAFWRRVICLSRVFAAGLGSGGRGGSVADVLEWRLEPASDAGGGSRGADAVLPSDGAADSARMRQKGDD